MKIVRVVEWEKYQHYKDRNPPWIKLHRELLTSNTWVSLDDASRVLAIAIMLVAAATGNKIPTNPGYLRRVAYLNSEPDLGPLVGIGFIEIVEENQKPASAPQADASNTQADARPEAEQSRGEAEQSRPDAALATKVRAKVSEMINSPTVTRFNRIDAWLAEGADPERDIYPAITRGLQKLNGPLRSLNWFDSFVAENRQDRTRPMPAARGKPEPAQVDHAQQTRDTWHGRILAVKNGMRWDDRQWGPHPSDPTNYIPADVREALKQEIASLSKPQEAA